MGTSIFCHHAASPASFLASIPHQYNFQMSQAWERQFLPSRGFASFLPCAYSHQYIFWESRAWERLFFCHHAASPRSSAAPIPIKMFLGDASVGTFHSQRVPRLLRPPLPPSRLFPSNAPPGSSTRGNKFFHMLRPFPPVTYPICSPPPRISLADYILSII